ncbi:MAG: replicative DNA helicase [Halanaerobiales bacterium]
MKEISGNVYKNVKYERQAIVTAIQNEIYLDKLMEKINTDCFTDELALKSFKWLKNKYNKNEKISLLRLDDEKEVDVDKLTDVGIQEFEYDSLLKLLLKYKKRRELYQGAKEIVKLTKNTELSIDNLNNKAQDIMFKLTSTQTQNKKIYEMEDVLDTFFQKVTKIQQSSNKISGLNTGFVSLDSQLKGLHKGHLFTVAAPTHYGKTSFTLQLALNMIKQGYHVVFFSLEMNVSEIGTKIVSLDSKVPTNDYLQKLEEFQRKNMNASLDRLMDLNLTVTDERNLSPTDIKAKCRKISRNKEIDVVMIDYLQNMKYAYGENDNKRIGNTCLELRNLAGELNVPVVLVSQMSRSGKDNPSMHNTRGSGRIEEISDEVLIINRPNKGNEKMEKIETAKIIVEKGRTTGGGVMTMDFYSQIQAWRDQYAEPIEVKSREQKT